MRDGLAKVNILNAMEAFPQLLEVYFVKRSTTLTAGNTYNLQTVLEFDFVCVQVNYWIYCSLRDFLTQVPLRFKWSKVLTISFETF